MTMARKGWGVRATPGLRWSGLVFMGFLLGGCALLDSFSGKPKDDSAEKIAPKSQRVAILELDTKLEPDPRIADLAVTVPAAVRNVEWPQPGGSPQNHFAHLQLAEGSGDEKKTLGTVWSVKAGRGSNTDAPLTAPPIVAGGRVFVLDSRVTVRAFGLEKGRRQWERDLTPEGERPRVGFGGGMAYDADRLYVVTGFGQITALDPATGETVWERRIAVPIRAAPTAHEGRVFITGTDNQLHAYDAATGKSLWTHRGITEAAGILSAVSPAVAGGVVVAPFSSGELGAFRVQNGRELWGDSLVRTRKATAMAGINDIAARPVIVGGRLYAVSHSGRMVAIDLRTGERVWTRNIAGIQTPWISGEFIFTVTVEGELICVSTRDGRIRWLTKLKRYENLKKRKGAIAWMGPMLLDGRLLMANSLGEMAFFSPKNGKVLVAFKGPGEAYIPPVVADGRVYLLTDDGRLSAME